MDDGGKFILIYTTFPTLEAAERVGGALVDERLAACVNILPGIISVYVWEGQRHREQEVAMLIKTRSQHSARVLAEVRRHHPYDNPALIELPVTGGSAEFLSWIEAQTQPSLPPNGTE